MKNSLFMRVLLSLILTLAIGCFLFRLVAALAKFDFAVASVALLACVLFGGVLWLVLFPRSTERLPALNPSDLPSVSQNSLVCRKAGVFGGESRIIIDFDADTIHFEHCFTANEFLARQKEHWSCPLDDVVEVERDVIKGVPYLSIVTTTGKAFYGSAGTNFEELSRCLQGRVRPGARAAAEGVLHPLMHPICLAGGVAGMIAGFLLMPQNAPVLLWYVAFFVGTAGGACGAYGLCDFMERVVRIPVVVPLGCAVVGFAAGIPFVLVVMGPLNLPIHGFPYTLFPCAFGLIGLALGIASQRRKSSARHGEVGSRDRKEGNSRERTDLDGINRR